MDSRYLLTRIRTEYVFLVAGRALRTRKHLPGPLLAYPSKIYIFNLHLGLVRLLYIYVQNSSNFIVFDYHFSYVIVIRFIHRKSVKKNTVAIVD